ncbi:lysozyme inhibitor LprI family protein [Paracoccus sp. R86501]|uniref:lysozyme inhibitor LprI family protein n=1 Tax=Paracoccus sp. R86501 TaxID=3101711 RepID=UPI003670770A
MRAALVLAVALAGPAMAQDGKPTFDGVLVDACLTERTDAPLSCAGKAADACIETDGGYSTVGMNYCTARELDRWDGLLNGAYAKLMAQSKAMDDEMADLGSAAPKQAPLLQQMQRDWIAFRDAACSYEGSRWGGGTGAGPAGTRCMMIQTARQYIWLNAYLDEGR